MMKEVHEIQNTTCAKERLQNRYGEYRIRIIRKNGKIEDKYFNRCYAKYENTLMDLLGQLAWWAHEEDKVIISWYEHDNDCKKTRYIDLLKVNMHEYYKTYFIE